MGVPEFLQSLREHGRLRVAAPTDPILPDQWQAAEPVLAEWDVVDSLDFPGTAPTRDPHVLRWAVERFYRACQFAVYRQVDAATLVAELSLPCPPAEPAVQHYSVDLVFRYLSDLFRLARSLSPGDPLCDQLRLWARAWPLSSVGMPLTEPPDPTPLCQDAGLLRLYIDRIIARQDADRLHDLRIRRATACALGHFAGLAPALSQALTNSANHC